MGREFRASFPFLIYLGGEKLQELCNRRGAEGAEYTLLPLQDQAGNSIAEEGDVEVYEQGYLQLRESEVGDDLGGVNGVDGLDGFELHEDLVIDDKVDAIPRVDARALIVNGHGNLAIYVEAALPELPAEAGAIRGRKQLPAPDAYEPR